MHAAHCLTRPARRPLAAALITTFGALALLGSARPAAAQAGGMPAAAPGQAEEEEIPHPFFTHMGLPEGVGVYSLRVLALAPRVDGQSKGDVAFHFETGITPRIGLHVRNDRFRNSDRTEAMFQFAAYVSKNGMNGFAPLIEFAFPTRANVSRATTLVGFTSSLGGSRWAFNQVVHYDPREDGGDGSLALVLKANRYIYPAFELLGEGGKGQAGVVNALGGIKVRVREGINLGFAYQIPITNAQDFSSQAVFGPEFGWRR